jgi:hypothetical protein
MKRAKTVGRRTLMVLGGLMLVLIAFAAFRIATHDRPSTEERIERNIDVVFTSGNPGYCDDLTTRHYLEQTTDEPWPFADEACEIYAGEGTTQSVAVSRVRVEGGRATARVIPSGGSLDGATVTVALVDEDGYWRLDRLVAIDRFDRAAFRRNYRRSFLTFGSSQSAASCAVEREERLSDAEIERGLLGGGASLFEPIAVECDRAGVERNTVAAIAGPEYGYPASGIACVERRLKEAEDEFVVAAGHAGPFGQLLLACDPRAPFDMLEHQLRAEDEFDREADECILAAFRRLSPVQAYRRGYEDERHAALLEGCKKTGA